MKLKTFSKCDVSVITEYTVFDRKGEYIDSFICNYLDREDGNVMRKNELIDKGADVEFVRVNSVTHMLSVTVRV